MDQARIAEIALRIEHRHHDDTWGVMEEERHHGHDSAESDPERGWGIKRIFRCNTCPDTVTIFDGIVGGPPPQR